MAGTFGSGTFGSGQFGGTAAGGGTTVTGGLPLEVDVALPGTVTKLYAAGLALETDSALAGLATKHFVAGIADEVDSALAGLASKTIVGGLPLEVDESLPGTVTKLYLGGLAEEIDVALPGQVTGGGGPVIVLVPLMQDGFIRDVSDVSLAHGPLIVVTVDNAMPPVTEQDGYMRDARGFLVVEAATGPGDTEQAGFLRTVAP